MNIRRWWHPQAIVMIMLLPTACSEPVAKNPQASTVVVFECKNLLIGLSEASCFEDIIGPGLLRVAFKPDPLESSWELSVSGLAALAERCAFEGSYRETRLSSLQGRGEASISCDVEPSIDRGYHEIQFRNRDSTPNTSIGITVTYSR